ncbi:hypothetical protein K0504_02360 [Neiella marina]|uniref:DUF4282 domain-containing protein n=1 Tax=Neiella holothuriorum TaxID=2870530 RepID=A0ABS7EC15_9GAMM|nr:hypothetical protein [Neiella holothuriorum]MBW8189865.1 hypothetical protein [Neiella holothuriorum]
MTIAHWKRLMAVLMWCGLAFILVGISLIIFTDLRTEGVHGVRIIALIIGAGLLLLIPSKLFITLLLMMHNDQHKHRNSVDR